MSCLTTRNEIAMLVLLIKLEPVCTVCRITSAILYYYLLFNADHTINSQCHMTHLPPMNTGFQ